MKFGFVSSASVASVLVFFLFHASSFASDDPRDLQSPDGQAACSRQLVVDPSADYVANVTKYREQTDKVTSSVEAARAAFLRLLPRTDVSTEPAIVASIGEGFGRDIKFFREQGLRAIGTDGSAAMVEEAARYLGTHDDFHVLVAQDFSLAVLGLAPQQKLAGIWAMASLHHVPTHELRDVLIQMRDALVSGGLIHASFIMGVGTPGQAEVAINRFWSRIDAPTLISIVQSVEGLEIINESGRTENDFFASIPSSGFHFYNLWLKRTL